MNHQPRYCLYCCLERRRPEVCPKCGPGFPGLEVESHPRFLPPGSVLDGRYLVGRVLGAGGFGITYMAVDLNLRTRVAMKEYMPRELAVRATDCVSAVVHSQAEQQDFEL